MKIIRSRKLKISVSIFVTAVWRNSALSIDKLKRSNCLNKNSASTSEIWRPIIWFLDTELKDPRQNPLRLLKIKPDGMVPGHPGVRYRVFGPAEADELRLAEVELEECQTCCCQLVIHSANERTIDALQHEEMRRNFYRFKRKRCPRCRKTVPLRIPDVRAQANPSNDLIVKIAEQHYMPARSDNWRKGSDSAKPRIVNH